MHFQLQHPISYFLVLLIIFFKNYFEISTEKSLGAKPPPGRIFFGIRNFRCSEKKTIVVAGQHHLSFDKNKWMKSHFFVHVDANVKKVITSTHLIIHSLMRSNNISLFVFILSIYLHISVFIIHPHCHL